MSKASEISQAGKSRPVATRPDRKRFIAIGAVVLVIVLVLISVLSYFLINRQQTGKLPFLGGDADIYMMSNTEGWIATRNVDGTTNDFKLHHTDDGGRNWKEVLSVPTNLVGNGKWYLSDKKAAVLDWGANKVWPPDGDVKAGTAVKTTVHYTIDGGNGWQEAEVDGLLVTPLAASGDQHVWVAGFDASERPDAANATNKQFNASLWQSSDGGKTWTKLFSGQPGGTSDELSTIVAASFSSENNGWLIGTTVGETATTQLYSTTDGGKSWQKVDSTFSGATDSPLSGNTGLRFFNDQEGVLLAYEQVSTASSGESGVPRANYTTTIYGTNDGGKTWNSRGTAESYIRSIDILDAQHVLFQPDLNGKTLKKSNDGGQNWEEFQAESPTSHLTLLNLTSSDTAWALGYEKPLSDPTRLATVKLLQSTDGGKTWHIVSQLLEGNTEL